jgi:hypothetical protein
MRVRCPHRPQAAVSFSTEILSEVLDRSMTMTPVGRACSSPFVSASWTNSTGRELDAGRHIPWSGGIEQGVRSGCAQGIVAGDHVAMRAVAFVTLAADALKS